MLFGHFSEKGCIFDWKAGLCNLICPIQSGKAQEDCKKEHCANQVKNEVDENQDEDGGISPRNFPEDVEDFEDDRAFGNFGGRIVNRQSIRNTVGQRNLWTKTCSKLWLGVLNFCYICRSKN